MSARSRRSQPGLPGLAPMCPHCGETDATIMVEDSDTTGGLICAERWECRQCGGVFWSLPTLALGPARR